MDPKHLLHQLMVGSITAHEERLRSRHFFVLAARKLLNELSKLSTRAALWIDYKWDMKYSKDQSELRFFVSRPNARPLGMSLPVSIWVRVNRHPIGVGRFQSSMHKWGFASTSILNMAHWIKPHPI